MTSFRVDVTGQYRQLYGFSPPSVGFTTIVAVSLRPYRRQATKHMNAPGLTCHLMPSKMGQASELGITLRTDEGAILP